MEHSVCHLRHFVLISCSFCRLRRFPPRFPRCLLSDALSPEDSKRARFISRFPNPLYETRVVYRVALHHLSTPNLPWNVMKHAAAQWLDPSKLHAEQPLSRPIRRGYLHRLHPRCSDDLQGWRRPWGRRVASRRERRENQHVRAFSQFIITSLRKWKMRRTRQRVLRLYDPNNALHNIRDVVYHKLLIMFCVYVFI